MRTRQCPASCTNAPTAHVCCQGLLLNLVAKHLSPDEIGSLKDSFLAMDEDGSGFLTVGTVWRCVFCGLSHTVWVCPGSCHCRQAVKCSLGVRLCPQADKLQNALSRCSVDPRATDVQRLMKQLDVGHNRCNSNQHGVIRSPI